MLAELGLPIELVAPFVPPSPKPAREVMKPMLVGVAHGTVHLMHLLSHDPNSLTHSSLGRCHFLFETLCSHGINASICGTL